LSLVQNVKCIKDMNPIICNVKDSDNKMKLTFNVCDIQKHDLEKYDADFTEWGDDKKPNLCSSVNSKCKKCGMQIQYFWSMKDFTYSITDPNTSMCYYSAKYTYGNKPVITRNEEW